MKGAVGKQNAASRRGVNRVALVHDWLTVPGGSELVLDRIASHFPSATVYTSIHNPETCRVALDNQIKTSFLQNLPLARSGKHYWYSPLMPFVYRNFNLVDCDLVISDSHSFAHHARGGSCTVHYCYYHTPARSLWVPHIDNRASSGFGAPVKRSIAKVLKRLDFDASKNPDYIVANSYTTANRILEFYGRKVDEVIYPPVDVLPWLDVPESSRRKGLLYWGRLVDYKRVDLLVEAAQQVDEDIHIVGGGPCDVSLRAVADQSPNVIFHGRLPIEALKELMSKCRAVVFPAYEDFGIVPVEAMAAGLPVIYFAVGGASESVTEEFGIPFEFQTVRSLVEAIERSHKMTPNVRNLRTRAWSFRTERFDSEFLESVARARRTRISTQG